MVDDNDNNDDCYYYYCLSSSSSSTSLKKNCMVKNATNQKNIDFGKRSEASLRAVCWCLLHGGGGRGKHRRADATTNTSYQLIVKKEKKSKECLA